jgi:mannose-6-phosphate isomerase-like protein (cupin superfamily)
MFIKKLKSCKEIIAGDKCILKELINPHKDDVKCRYSLAHAWVKPKSKTLPHKLKTSELYYILQGRGIMHIDNETKEVEPYDAIYIPSNAVQYIENTDNEDLVFLCMVDPAWKAEVEEIL